MKRGILDSPATEVHHVRPIGTGRTWEEMQSLAFDEGNLEALCHSCHVAAHKLLRWERVKGKGAAAKQRIAERAGTGSETCPGVKDALSAFMEDFGL